VAVVGELNLVLRGWANYFRLGAVSKAYRAVDSHARYRLRQWLCSRHKSTDRVEIVSPMSISTGNWACSA